MVNSSLLHSLEPNRRELICALVSCGIGIGAATAIASTQQKHPMVCAYTEHFQSLPISRVCQVFKQLGVQGLDLTVRPGGHIAPENAKKELPKAVKTAESAGLKIMMLTTAITRFDDNAKDIIATCNDLGIRHIKMGYYRVGEFGTLKKRLADVKQQLESLVAATEKYDVKPCVHVHSGPTIPSNGFMLYELIRELPPERIGAYLDSYHMTITGANGGWKQAIDLLKPWVSLVALKNFQWHAGGRDKNGQKQWRTDYCLLEDGVAPISDFVRTVQATGYNGFYTLHTEYRKPVKECTEMTAADYAFLKRVFASL